MILARMIETDEDALICDLAETYHIYNYRSLPARTVATLAAGLRSNARIIQIMSDIPLSFEQMALVKIYDVINWIAWAKTKDGYRGRNAPEQLLSKIMNRYKKEEAVGFDSAEEFEKARAEMLKGL